MQYLEIIKQEIEKIFQISFGIEGVNFTVGFPDTLEHGDVTTNVCLVFSKILSKSPKEVFELLRAGLTPNPSPIERGESALNFIEKLEFINPGFVNIWLRKEVIEKALESRGGGDDIKFVSKKYYGKRVLVEHSSPNLFKSFNVGHLMNNFTGEFAVRILREVGAIVTTMSYPSDVSIGIAKAMYILIKDNENNFNVNYLGECYVKGVKEFDENDSIQARVKEIANIIFSKKESQEYELYLKAKKACVDYFIATMKNLGSEFDSIVFESDATIEGDKIVREFLSKGKTFELSEGAIIFKPDESRKDINTTVFINSQGNPTYAGKDIGLLEIKFKNNNLDKSIFITDNEQTPHFKVVLAAAENMGGEFSEYARMSEFIPHGRMTFKGKKMSSRLGGVPNGEEVINAVLEVVRKKSGGNESDMTVALSALRVSILRSKPGVNIDFDPDRATSFEGDSGPYLCYTFARCCSLLERGNVLGQAPSPTLPPNGEGEVPTSSNLLRRIFQFEKIVVDTAFEIAPQKLIKYLFELAGEFNAYYAKNKIIDENDLEKTKYNLYLTRLVQTVLKKGLYLIGVDAPKKM